MDAFFDQGGKRLVVLVRVSGGITADAIIDKTGAVAAHLRAKVVDVVETNQPGLVRLTAFYVDPLEAVQPINPANDLPNGWAR